MPISFLQAFSYKKKRRGKTPQNPSSTHLNNRFSLEKRHFLDLNSSRTVAVGTRTDLIEITTVLMEDEDGPNR